MPNQYIRIGGRTLREKFRRERQEQSRKQGREAFGPYVDTFPVLVNGHRRGEGRVEVRGLKLEGWIFYERHMEDVDFVDCSFVSCSFWGFRMGGSTFTNCDLSGISAGYTDFYKAAFVNCNMMGAQMLAVNLDSASFQNCEVCGAEFCGAYMGNDKEEAALLAGMTGTHLANFTSRDWRGHAFNYPAFPVSTYKREEEKELYRAKERTKGRR